MLEASLVFPYGVLTLLDMLIQYIQYIADKTTTEFSGKKAFSNGICL